MWKLVAIVMIAVQGVALPTSPEVVPHTETFDTLQACETYRTGKDHAANLAELLADEQAAHRPADVVITTECRK